MLLLNVDDDENIAFFARACVVSMLNILNLTSDGGKGESLYLYRHSILCMAEEFR